MTKGSSVIQRQSHAVIPNIVITYARRCRVAVIEPYDGITPILDKPVSEGLVIDLHARFIGEEEMLLLRFAIRPTVTRMGTQHMSPVKPLSRKGQAAADAALAAAARGAHKPELHFPLP